MKVAWPIGVIMLASGVGPCGGGYTPSSGPSEECEDGKDNNNDGDVDCCDVECMGLEVCAHERDCDDGLDEDCDGWADRDDYVDCPVLSPTQGWIDVDAGEDRACALRNDGSVVCWGDVDGVVLGQPPSGGPYVDVTVGAGFACALAATGEVECWGPGQYDYGQTQAPEGSFSDVSADWNHVCAVTADGAVTCWGSDDHGESSTPIGMDFAQVGAGWNHSCGLTHDGEIECWGCVGSISPESCDEPPGPFAHLEVGGHGACARTAAGEMVCWGRGQLDDGEGWRDVSIHHDRQCGIRSDDELVCNGAPFLDVNIPSPLARISVSETWGCAVDEDSALWCWVLPGGSAATLP